MNMLTLIVMNAVLAAVVVYGIVLLLASGIRADRPAGRNVQTLPARKDRERLAA